MQFCTLFLPIPPVPLNSHLTSNMIWVSINKRLVYLCHFFALPRFRRRAVRILLAGLGHAPPSGGLLPPLVLEFLRRVAPFPLAAPDRAPPAGGPRLLSPPLLPFPGRAGQSFRRGPARVPAAGFRHPFHRLVRLGRFRAHSGNKCFFGNCRLYRPCPRLGCHLPSELA